MKLLCLVLSLFPALAQDKQPKPKAATSPEQAVELLDAAAKAEDMESFLAQISNPFRDLMRLGILEEEIDDIQRETLDAKFGKDNRRGFRMEIKFTTQRVKSVELLDKRPLAENKVLLKVREFGYSFRDDMIYFETDFLAVKEGDAWKLLRPFTPIYFGGIDKETKVRKKDKNGKEIEVIEITLKEGLEEIAKQLQEQKLKELNVPQQIARLEKRKKAAERVAAVVKTGKYTNRREAQQAFSAAMREEE